MSEGSDCVEVVVDGGVGEDKLLGIEAVVGGQKIMKTRLSLFDILMVCGLCWDGKPCRVGEERVGELGFIDGELVVGICEVRFEESHTIAGLAKQTGELLDLVVSVGKFAFEMPLCEQGGVVALLELVVSGGRNRSGGKLAIQLCRMGEKRLCILETDGQVLFVRVRMLRVGIASTF